MFLTVVSGLLTLGGGVFSYLQTQEQAEAQQDVIDAQLELDARNRVLGIPIQYFVILIAVVALVVIVAIINAKKKN